MGLAIEHIKQNSGKKTGEDQGVRILNYLGLPEKALGEANESTVTDMVKVLKRVAKIIHPEAHPNEPPLVKRALGFLVIPVTSGLVAIRDKRRKS